MLLSLKTMEVQIKGGLWNKRFRTVQVYWLNQLISHKHLEGKVYNLEKFALESWYIEHVHVVCAGNQCHVEKKKTYSFVS